MSELKTCPMCEGTRKRAIMCEINGRVDETLTRPCDTCWGDGLVYITDGGIIPWRKGRTWPAAA